jgi:hypothetical protein
LTRDTTHSPFLFRKVRPKPTRPLVVEYVDVKEVLLVE